MPIPLLLAILLTLWSGGAAAQAADPVSVEVEITGVDEPLRETLRSSLSIVRERKHPLLTEHRLKALHRQAPQEIRKALEPFGYYAAKVESELEPREGGWLARYAVDKGPPVRVTSVELQLEGAGRDDKAFADWRRRFPLKEGDVLVHETYERAKSELQRLVRAAGYFDAELTEHRIAVDPAAGSARITLRMETGERYRFGAVRFGDIPLQEGFLQRFVPFEPGAPYEAEELLALQQALTDSDYFERVDVQPRIGEAREYRVPIDVDLTMRPRTRYTFGLGYGTDTGPRGSVGFERRWLNRRGHRLGGELTASDIKTEFNLEYRVPLAQPRTDYLGYIADYTEESTDTTRRETSTLGVGLTQLVGGWQRTASLNYLQESFNVAGSSDQSQMLVPGLGWQRIQADDRLFPEHGWRLAVDTKAASENLLSSTNLAQVLLRFKHVASMIGGRVISRVDAGASNTSDFDSVPVSLRFFAGGDQSVRGYEFNSLGPENSAGEVEGGKNLLVFSVEYDRFWSEKWGAAVFIDQGNAFNDFSDYDLAQGVGAGVRYRLPFGLIRVDIASAVSEPGRPWRLHISIGPEL